MKKYLDIGNDLYWAALLNVIILVASITSIYRLVINTPVTEHKSFIFFVLIAICIVVSGYTFKQLINVIEKYNENENTEFKGKKSILIISLIALIIGNIALQYGLGDIDQFKLGASSRYVGFISIFILCIAITTMTYISGMSEINES